MKAKVYSSILTKFICVQMAIVLFGGCARPQLEERGVSGKLQTIVIQNEALSGTPKEIVAQLNDLSKKYDLPNHEGVAIRFAPSVNSANCQLGIRSGDNLASYIDEICKSCGAQYRIESNSVIIELLPLSDRRTINLTASLPKGMAELCQQFRAKSGEDRHELGKQLFEMLPRSPITSDKKVTEIEEFISYDYKHPNYTLHKKDILELLGGPDRNVNNQTFYYSLEPRGTMIWELGVEFGDFDFAINPSLAGYLRK